MVRRACAFLRDLGTLTPEHQRRWETYEESTHELHPHPVWFAAMMGHWPDGIGPFEKVIAELRAANELFARAFERDLLTNTDRPRELGWILRPSGSEWEQFVLTMDKLLSDNLRGSALDAAEAPRKSTDGEAIGTIRRLEHVLVAKAAVSLGEAADLLRPWREVRRARQDPAHALRENVTDETFVRRQAQLLVEVGRSLVGIRTALISQIRRGRLEPPGDRPRRQVLLVPGVIPAKETCFSRPRNELVRVTEWEPGAAVEQRRDELHGIRPAEVVAPPGRARRARACRGARPCAGAPPGPRRARR